MAGTALKPSLNTSVYRAPNIIYSKLDVDHAQNHATALL